MTTEPPLLPLLTYFAGLSCSSLSNFLSEQLPGVSLFALPRSSALPTLSVPSGGRAARFPPPVIPPGALSYGDFPMTRSSTLLPEGMLISAVREL